MSSSSNRMVGEFNENGQGKWNTCPPGAWCRVRDASGQPAGLPQCEHGLISGPHGSGGFIEPPNMIKYPAVETAAQAREGRESARQMRANKA